MFVLLRKEKKPYTVQLMWLLKVEASFLDL